MNKRTKYRNASCIIVSRMLGMSGCLPCRGFLAMKTTVKNERTSTIARDVESVNYTSIRIRDVGSCWRMGTHRRQLTD